jgi:membrane-associated phospholipid phosphatase
MPEQIPPGLRARLWPPGWLHHESPALIANPLAQALVVVLILSVIFLLFPQLDLAFAGLFYDGSGFPMARLPAFIALRDLGNDITRIVVLVLILVVIIKLALPAQRSLIAPRDVLFVGGTLLAGPGILVNLVFKNNWGRPRPVEVTAFGGDHPFVGAWHMSHACISNCSFVSGEASSAIWLVTLAVLVPLAWQRPVLRFLVVLAALLSLNRIAMGGHFLSDVLLAWAMTLAVIAAAYRYLYVTPLPALENERLEGGLTAAGQGIRNLVAKATEAFTNRNPPPPPEPPAA